MNHPIRNDDDNDDDDASEWIRLALLEYDQVARLRNSQLLLANSASAAVAMSGRDGGPSSSSSSSSSYSSPSSDRRENYDDRDNYNDNCDSRDMGRNEAHSLRHLSNDMRRHEISGCVANYHRAINDVRTTHASLKSRLGSHRVRGGRHDSNDDGDGGAVVGGKYFDGGRTRTRRRARRPSSNEGASRGEAFARHIELAERVIRTVMGSSSSGGMCGALHEDGILDASSANDRRHDASIVALSSLRASISRLTVEYGGG
jgi:hypothetical protein